MKTREYMLNEYNTIMELRIINIRKMNMSFEW